jgi:hypothetical protein
MTTPAPDQSQPDQSQPDPQPRDIALEMETPEQAADLEAQSEPHES